MVITRTPFRISFFGGGTDYPDWYLKRGGSILATTIDKYCYISLRNLPPFFEHKTRVVYSKAELCKNNDEINHPAVRETLRFLKMDRGLEIHHDGDLPARSGMGSSSSFTVGLLQALYAIMGVMPSKKRLALESINIEQNLIGETVGSQDQVSAAYGGLNHITFEKSGEIAVKAVTIPTARIAELNSHLMLFFTGVSRTASDVAKSYVNGIEKRSEQIKAIGSMVEEGLNILSGNKCICHFGELLHETWKIKRSLSDKVTNNLVDEYYMKAREQGAIGGKITGAGGGGFLLLFVPMSFQKRIRKVLSDLIYVPFSFDSTGSQVIFYEPENENNIGKPQ